jgi:hypothetical protein
MTGQGEKTLSGKTLKKDCKQNIVFNIIVFWDMTPTPKKEAVRFSETSLNFYQYIQRHIPEKCHADSQRRKTVTHRVTPKPT